MGEEVLFKYLRGKYLHKEGIVVDWPHMTCEMIEVESGIYARTRSRLGASFQFEQVVDMPEVKELEEGELEEGELEEGEII